MAFPQTLLNKNFWTLALSMTIAANLAFFSYSYSGWNEGYWAVVTIVAVASVGLANTVTKMWARLAATVLGALYAAFAAHFFIDQGNYSAIALDRVYQVCFGIIVLAVVNSILSLFFNKDKPHRLVFTMLLGLWRELKIINLNRSTLLTSLKVVIAMIIIERFINVMAGIAVGLLVVRWVKIEKVKASWSKSVN